ncbi:MAG TPA: DUF6798 domain-containing protein, partial [Silvibacterium sp.]|nr:DUF6798 domain-containing protein [Silvibacterium sp.]
IPLAYLLLATHLTSIFVFLLSCWSLARRIFASPAAQWSAVALTGACFTLPVAGTALLLMDPYVTARSISTPLGLFALVAAIDHRWLRTALFLLLTALMHPLMAIYVAAFVFLFTLADLGHLRGACVLSLSAVIASGVIYLATLHLPVSAVYNQAIHSSARTYLFPSQWSWYEDIGLVVPLSLFAFAAYRLGSRVLAGKLCIAAVLLGTSSMLSAFLFVRASGPYLLTRLQLLRGFHILYLVGIILLGGFIGELQLNRSPDHSRRQHSRWAAYALLIAVTVAMFLVQRHTYPLSAHLEFPGESPRNPWQQAFVWIRANTPQDAVFAVNPELVFLDGEDSQGFRATTGRSLLADDKDEGVVVLFPQLAPRWAAERNAQAGLDQFTDPERLARLRPLGATWLLLSSNAETSLPCPYHNSVAQVCHLGR